MRNKIVLFLTILISFVLQCTLFQSLAIGSIAANLTLILVISMALTRGSNTAMFCGFFSGLLWDLMSGGYLGVYALFYLLIGYLAGLTYRIYYDNNSKVPMILVALADFILNTGVYLIDFFLQGNTGYLYYVRRIIIPEMIYTVAVCAIVYRIFYWISHTLMTEERKEGNYNWLLK